MTALLRVSLLLCMVCLTWMVYVVPSFPPDKLQVEATFIKTIEDQKTENGKRPVVFDYTVDFMPNSTYSTIRYLYDDEINALYRTKKKNIEVSLFSVNKELHHDKKKWETVFYIVSLFCISLIVSLAVLYMYGCSENRS